MKKALAIMVLATLAAAVMAGGSLGTPYQEKAGNLGWTNSATSPAYIERIDIRCSTINTATVTAVNYGISNTLLVDTGTVMQYAPATANARIDKGGYLTVTFGHSATTNKVAPYLFAK
jgi:hypothetical protein